MPKKKAAKMGRPPAGNRSLDDKVLFECMRSQKARWKKAAAKSKLTLSAWVRSVLDAAAG